MAGLFWQVWPIRRRDECMVDLIAMLARSSGSCGIERCLDEQTLFEAQRDLLLSELDLHEGLSIADSSCASISRFRCIRAWTIFSSHRSERVHKEAKHRNKLDRSIRPFTSDLILVRRISMEPSKSQR